MGPGGSSAEAGTLAQGMEHLVLETSSSWDLAFMGPAGPLSWNLKLMGQTGL